MLEKGIIVNNRYKVLDIIGRGGTSFVYLIRDIHIGKRMALKEIQKNNKLAFTLARSEVNLLKSIDFDKFPRITDAFTMDDSLYLVNDYVEGISLDRIITKKKISRHKAVKWAEEILDALNYLHGLSPPILYLDLKPENIIVLPNGNIKMIDFGIARRIATDYIPLGTPGYAAPEQYDYVGSRLSERTDIFAFGMTYYAIRCGKIPDRDLEIVRTTVRLSSVFSRAEKNLILKCIQSDPKDRYDCIQSVSNHLKQLSSSKLNPGKIINYTGISIILIILMISGILIYWNKVSKDNLARQMVYEASNYINDGDYTRQGLKVITTFIDSGCLDNQTMEIFTYDVAMNYFLIQQDYNLAYRYFSHLDIDKYKEIPLLMQLCDAERGFEYDEDNILKSIGRLYDIASKTTNDSRKHEMYFVVARCYERYDPNMSSGSKKAITVLEEGKRQLVADSGDMSLEEINDTKEKYDRQLETLYMKTKNRIQKNEE